MSAPNSWVVRDVPRATFVDVATRYPLFYLQDLKTSGLENSAETVYARGGTGNPKIVGFSSNREAKIDLENAVFDNAALAMMTGNAVVKGVATVGQREELDVVTNAAAIKFTPKGGKIKAIFKRNDDGSHGDEFVLTSATVATGEYKITGKNITFFTGDLVAGDKVIVYYDATTDASANTITISSDKFAGSFGLILDVIVKSPFDQKDYAAQIEVYAAKMEDNWSLTMAADGDPSSHTMPIEILKQAGRTDMYRMVIYDGDKLVSV